MPEDELWQRVTRSVYYDPQSLGLRGSLKFLLACEGDQNCRVAMFRSTDALQTLEFVNYVNVPDNRNMVIFPERAKDGRFMRLEHPSIPAQGGKAASG